GYRRTAAWVCRRMASSSRWSSVDLASWSAAGVSAACRRASLGVASLAIALDVGHRRRRAASLPDHAEGAVGLQHHRLDVFKRRTAMGAHGGAHFAFGHALGA